ncbi:MAG: polysaccharide deacetylase family protein [Terriglobales bacterium]
MLRNIRRATFRALQTWGVSRLVADSRWRRQRLLILCYHGVSQEDEHLWRPNLYMESNVLRQRLDILQRGEYNVLPLGTALQHLHAGELPPRSVVITFDDGMCDFYRRAYPLLKSCGFPVTVYQTTYYSHYQRPVFNLICSYMLWKRRGMVLDKGKELGLKPPLDLRTESSREEIVLRLMRGAEVDHLNGADRDALAATLASVLQLDYDELLRKRLLHVMSPQEISELAAAGVDFQLHAHRHRTPMDEASFRKEIQENRQRLQAITNSDPRHFCYPSGEYHSQFLPWLDSEDVISATTCNPGLVTTRTHPLLLPRFVDTSARSGIEFEGWLAGVGLLLAFKRSARTG